MARKKAAKAAELEEDALIVEYLRQRQLKEQVQHVMMTVTMKIMQKITTMIIIMTMIRH